MIAIGSLPVRARTGQPLNLPCTAGVTGQPLGQAMPSNASGQALVLLRLTIAPGGGFQAQSCC